MKKNLQTETWVDIIKKSVCFISWQRTVEHDNLAKRLYYTKKPINTILMELSLRGLNMLRWYAIFKQVHCFFLEMRSLQSIVLSYI